MTGLAVKILLILFVSKNHIKCNKVAFDFILHYLQF
jgi:hypothetical protein